MCERNTRTHCFDDFFLIEDKVVIYGMTKQGKRERESERRRTDRQTDRLTEPKTEKENQAYGLT